MHNVSCTECSVISKLLSAKPNRCWVEESKLIMSVKSIFLAKGMSKTMMKESSFFDAQLLCATN